MAPCRYATTGYYEQLCPVPAATTPIFLLAAILPSEFPICTNKNRQTLYCRKRQLKTGSTSPRTLYAQTMRLFLSCGASCIMFHVGSICHGFVVRGLCTQYSRHLHAIHTQSVRNGNAVTAIFVWFGSEKSGPRSMQQASSWSSGSCLSPPSIAAQDCRFKG